ncbi:MAG: hypothetical protein LBM98_05155 [Oscillospiraceae bacterium]|nr:hypothetical protein [Oscillospiraceae bacterium]
MRYVGRYRCEAIQCRGETIRTTYRRILRQPWIASPHNNSTYRKCGGGFAKTGLASPSPVPAQCAGTLDGGRVRARRGEPPRRYAVRSLPRGEFTRVGFRQFATPRPSSKPHSPLGRGAARRRRGGFPRRAYPRPNSRL